MLRVMSGLCAIGMAFACGAEAAVADRATISFSAHGQGSSPYNGYPAYAGLVGSVEFYYQDKLEKYGFDDVITASMWGYAGYTDFFYKYDKYNQKYWDIDVFWFDIDLHEYLKTGRPTDIIGGVSYNGYSFQVGISFDSPYFFGTDYNHANVGSSSVAISYTGAGSRLAPIPLPAPFWLLTAALSAAGIVRSRRAGQAKSTSALIAN